MTDGVDLKETDKQLSLTRRTRKESALLVNKVLDIAIPTCVCCGAMAMVAGAALFAHIPVIATTAVLAAAGCAWFMVNTDRHPVGLVAQHAVYGGIATGIAGVASLVGGPAGAMVAGGVVLGAGLITKFVDYMRGNER